MVGANDPWVIAPLACLAGGAFGLALVARLLTRRSELLSIGAAAAIGAALTALVALTARTLPAWKSGLSLPAWGSQIPGGAYFAAEPGALFLIGVALGLGFAVALFSGRYLALDERYVTYYPLLLVLIASLAGMLLSADLFTLYLTCELAGVSAYVLVAFRRHTDTAIEAGFKYLVMGTVGTISLLMGIALLYRQSGSLAIAQPGAMATTWGRLGTALILVGLAVKSALVPMHTWLPDAHGRAPSSVSALLSGIVIQTALYVLVKLGLSLGLPPRALGTALIVAALLNMTTGNLMALVQTHTKRLLAYSTIAQTGYVLFGVGVGLRYSLPAALQAALFLLLGHALMKGLAFLSKGVCHFYLHSTTVAELRGTRDRMPLISVTFATALVGLAGVPPLAGFAGKWFILAEALHAPDLLAVVGVAAFLLNTLLALGYYLPLVVMLFTPGAQPEARVRISGFMQLPLLALGGLALAVGLLPGPWMAWAEAAAAYLAALGR